MLSSLTKSSLTCDDITAGVRIGPNTVNVFATLNLTFATRSVAIVKMVGSINLSVTSAPHASAKTWKFYEIKIKQGVQFQGSNYCFLCVKTF